jgi:hypothetical protein
MEKIIEKYFFFHLRFLVGLRWWTEIDDNGKENWMYES